MILRIENKISGGAYADIFLKENLVYKLFLSGRHPENMSQGLDRKQDDERRHNTFLSECEAYECANAHALLCQHIPRFYGSCTIEDVRNANCSVAYQYNLTDCCIMEYVNAEPRKLGVIRDLEHIRTALKAFREAGIHYTIDASVFMADDPQHFKFIDFAIKEFELWSD